MSKSNKQHNISEVVILNNNTDESNQVCGTVEHYNLNTVRNSAYQMSIEVSINSESSENNRSSSNSSSNDITRLRSRSQSWCYNQREEVNTSDVRIIRERLVRTQTWPQTSAVKTFTKHQKMTLILLALVDFMSFCSMSIMAPFFPKEATEKGISETMSGFVFSFYALVMFISSPIFGKALPYIGAKFMFLSGVFLAGLCNIVFGLLEYMIQRDVFLVFCFIIRGLEALGASAYSTASYVFVVNTFPNNIGSVLGILETFVGLGMSIGPAIGGLLYSVGGFGLPFYVLGVVMLLVVPINYFLLVDDTEYNVTNKSGSIIQLFQIPSVLVTGLVIVVVSNVWAFLDPTLEPHLRQFGLTTNQIGLIFLLFSALYGIFSPLWGWLADRIQNHWCMMVWGLFLCTIGLLLLGPTPFVPGLKSTLWINLLALSILGVSVALTLLPTFQGVLTSSIEEGGCPQALATYSVVAGVWSCCYSLGEVIGPSLGGVLSHHYGFPICSTVMASMCFVMAIITLSFFALRESYKLVNTSASLSCTNQCSGSTSISDISVSDSLNDDTDEAKPLVTGDNVKHYCTIESLHPRKKHKNEKKYCKVYKIKDAISFILMFKFITLPLNKFTKPAINVAEKSKPYCSTNQEQILVKFPCENNFEGYLKKYGSGIVSKIDLEISPNSTSIEMMNYNKNKVKYFEKSCRPDVLDPWRETDDVTNIKSTIALSRGGACEV